MNWLKHELNANYKQLYLEVWTFRWTGWSMNLISTTKNKNDTWKHRAYAALAAYTHMPWSPTQQIQRWTLPLLINLNRIEQAMRAQRVEISNRRKAKCSVLSPQTMKRCARSPTRRPSNEGANYLAQTKTLQEMAANLVSLAQLKNTKPSTGTYIDAW